MKVDDIKNETLKQFVLDSRRGSYQIESEVKTALSYADDDDELLTTLVSSFNTLLQECTTMSKVLQEIEIENE